MYEELKKIIQKYTEETVTPESDLVEDLGLTSLDVVSIVGDFEDAFGIEIEDEDILDFTTVADIIDYLNKHQGQSDL